jgi:hypothetical protein
MPRIPKPSILRPHPHRSAHHPPFAHHPPSAIGYPPSTIGHWTPPMRVSYFSRLNLHLPSLLRGRLPRGNDRGTIGRRSQERIRRVRDGPLDQFLATCSSTDETSQDPLLGALWWRRSVRPWSPPHDAAIVRRNTRDWQCQWHASGEAIITLKR